MEAELVALATAAARQLIAASDTDQWPWIREEFARLIAHGGGGDALNRELETLSDDHAAAQEDGDPDAVEGLIALWRRRVLHLLQDSPELTAPLRELVDRLAASDGAPTAADHRSGGGVLVIQDQDEGVSYRVRPVHGNTPPGPPFGDDEEDEW
ncbi:MULTISPECIES: hypothetical protein [unclassified Streptomyces]|uniref:hypothetical protein n=1 Tax=unclassified Streptomyces TaxID=2593676 RepID=UPI00380FC7DF